MDATAVRASTQAATGATAAGTTNGPSSSPATTGGGPIAAPTQPVLLGERLLPAPAGEPQTIHLSDGSMLVPVARVDASGSRVPLAGGPGSAQLRPTGAGAAPAAAPAVSTAPAATAAPAAPASGVAGGGSTGSAAEPLGFLYNDLYFKRIYNGGDYDVNDGKAVESRVIKSTMAYLVEEEPNVDDFAVTAVSMRRVDPVADRDLLAVNPNALYYVDVQGHEASGKQRSIPTVVNRDGDTYTDPRLRGG